MFDPGKYLDKAEREYLLDGKASFIYALQHTQEVRANYKTFEAQLRKNPAFRVTRHRDVRDGLTLVGRPCEITLAESDLLAARPELQPVRAAFQAAKDSSQTIDVLGFIRKNFSECRKKWEVLPSVVRSLEYLISHRDEVRGLYPRQIPHSESSKLIENESLFLSLYRHHKNAAATDLLSISGKEPWLEFLQDFGLQTKPPAFQLLAPRIVFDGHELTDFYGLLSSDDMHRWNLNGADGTLIVENFESFYALRGKLGNYALIFGAGKMAASIGFLRPYLPEPILYWGDMDKEGYEIFANVKEVLPSARPICMGTETIDRNIHLKRGRAPEKVGTTPIPELSNAYERVCRDGFQIEQEKLKISNVIEMVAALETAQPEVE